MQKTGANKVHSGLGWTARYFCAGRDPRRKAALKAVIAFRVGHPDDVQAERQPVIPGKLVVKGVQRNDGESGDGIDQEEDNTANSPHRPKPP